VGVVHVQTVLAVSITSLRVEMVAASTTVVNVTGPRTAETALMSSTAVYKLQHLKIHIISSGGVVTCGLGELGGAFPLP